MSIIDLLHDRLATTVMLFFLFVGLWGLLEFARGGSLGGNIAGALIIGQVLIVVQGAFGLILFFGHQRPYDSVHVLYGLTAALIMPFLWSYTKGRNPRQGLLLYSLIALFIFGLAIRGMATGAT